MDGVAREKPLKKKDCVAREKEGVLRMVKGKFYLYFLNMWGIKERWNGVDGYFESSLDLFILLFIAS